MFRSAEQENFYQRLFSHIESPRGPLLLEGTTGLGKTRAYLAAVVKAVGSGNKVALVFPTHMLIEQLLASADLQLANPGELSFRAFLPRSKFETRALYVSHRQQALDADVMLCTSASVIIDQRLQGEYNGATKRDFLIFDEADQLPEAAALQSDCEISADVIKELGIKADSLEEITKELLTKRELDAEVKAAALLILESLTDPAWYKTVGKTEDGGVMLYHRLPGRLLKRVANQSNVAFISATLTINGNFDDFKRSMGIEHPSSLSGVIEPKHHGELKFEVSDLDVNSQEWLSICIKAITECDKPCLVVTPSHELAETLGSLLPQAIVRSREETASSAATRTHESGTLIAAGAWAGLDTSIQWRSIVVPRIPYDRPIVLDEKIESSFLNGRNTAIRRMRQVFGRGLRTPDARCKVFILDGRYKNIEASIPHRFKVSWGSRAVIEGRRVEITLSRAERDPSVRKHALKHYGHKCTVCDFEPRVESQLDVHHLFPLADGGERVTSLADVAVLCANCHRLAHSTGLKPLSIEVLREMFKQTES